MLNNDITTHICYQYDPAGRPTHETTDSGDETWTGYDIMGRITAVRNNDAEVQYEYNGAGDVTVAYTLAPPGVPPADAQPATAIAYSYDAAGNRAAMIENAQGMGSWSTSYEYDSAGRVSAISTSMDGSAFRAGFDYDGHGRRAMMRRSAGAASGDQNTVYEYAPSTGLLEGVFNYNNTGEEISHFTYTYDAAGRRTGMSTRDFDAVYSYDDLDRLTGLNGGCFR